jgi:serine/threonine protein kinase
MRFARTLVRSRSFAFQSSNILVREEDGKLRAVLIDFSSAVNEEALNNGMYGMYGPSTDEETEDYSPPEVLFSSVDGSAGAPYHLAKPTTYDIWSVGVVFLEMILGTSRVFQVDRKTRAILEHRLKDQSQEVKEKAILFRAMVEYVFEIFGKVLRNYLLQILRLSSP